MRQFRFIKHFIFFLFLNYSVCFGSSIQLSDFDQESARKIKQQLTANLQGYNLANKSIFISRAYEGESKEVMDFETSVVLFLRTCGFRVIRDIDGHGNGLGVGENIEDFMIDSIQSSSCVMAFLTKQYLTRYRDQKSGIRKEYNLIQNRIGDTDFVFFPICLGNIQDCIPPLWRSLFCLPCVIPETSLSKSLCLQDIILNLLTNPLFLPQSYHDFIGSIFSKNMLTLENDCNNVLSEVGYLAPFDFDNINSPMMREDTLTYRSPSNSTMPIGRESTCVFDSHRAFMLKCSVADSGITMMKTREDDDFDNDDTVHYNSLDINLFVYGSSYVEGSNRLMSDWGSEPMKRLSPTGNNSPSNYKVVG